MFQLHFTMRQKNKLKNNVCGYICFTIDSGVVSRIDGMDYLQNDKRIELSNLKHLKIGSISNNAYGDKSLRLDCKSHLLWGVYKAIKKVFK